MAVSQPTSTPSFPAVVRYQPPQDPTDGLPKQVLSDAVDQFQQHGVLWVQDVFDPRMIASVRDHFFEKYLSQPPGQMSRKHAVVGDLRFMVTVKVKGPLNQPNLYAHPFLMSLLERFLGHDLQISSFGSVVTLPGGENQPIHFDHPPLFESEHECIQLPPHAITLVVPLIDITRETGPTAVWPGSHRALGAREQMVGLTKNPSWDDATFPLPRLGDAYLMDYRLIHGGMANRSEQPRPILYIVYARSWFRDAYNFNDQPAVLISEKQLRKVPGSLQHLWRRVR